MRIPGRPVPYDRANTIRDRRTGKTRRVHSARYGGWRQMAAQAVALQRRGRTWAEPVKATIIVGPAGVDLAISPVIGSDRGGLKGDLDNYVKAVLDAAQEGGLILDDRWVVAIEVYFAGSEVEPGPEKTRPDGAGEKEPARVDHGSERTAPEKES